MTVTLADPDDHFGLPSWLYSSPRFFAAERERVLAPSWQVVCHLNDIPRAGDFHTFEFIDESIVVVRHRDGVPRAFSNVCLHRAATLLDGPNGQCDRIVCPYHAWTYDLEGRLVGVPLRETYPDLRLGERHLPPIELELYKGFIFVRLESGGPSVAEMMAPYADELEPYRFEALQPAGRVDAQPPDSQLEDHRRQLFRRSAHHRGSSGPGPVVRSRLRIRGQQPGWTRCGASLRDELSDNLSERAYQTLLPDVEHLPAERKRLWAYYKLWPNFAFDVYPDQVDFMQWIPVSSTETLIREIAYVLPDARREMMAARYLNWRINRRVNVEDTELVERVQQGMASRWFEPGPLSETEVCLRGFARRLRALIPEARLRRPPADWRT